MRREKNRVDREGGGRREKNRVGWGGRREEGEEQGGMVV